MIFTHPISLCGRPDRSDDDRWYSDEYSSEKQIPLRLLNITNTTPWWHSQVYGAHNPGETFSRIEIGSVCLHYKIPNSEVGRRKSREVSRAQLYE